jgi:hypothetical protein
VVARGVPHIGDDEHPSELKQQQASVPRSSWPRTEVWPRLVRCRLAGGCAGRQPFGRRDRSEHPWDGSDSEEIGHVPDRVPPPAPRVARHAHHGPDRGRRGRRRHDVALLQRPGDRHRGGRRRQAPPEMAATAPRRKPATTWRTRDSTTWGTTCGTRGTPRPRITSRASSSPRRR